MIVQGTLSCRGECAASHAIQQHTVPAKSDRNDNALNFDKNLGTDSSGHGEWFIYEWGDLDDSCCNSNFLHGYRALDKPQCVSHTLQEKTYG